MKAETRTLQQVLHGDRRFVVPVYQRPYVWTRERQWEPLWNDIESTAVRLAEARADGYAKELDGSQADQSAPPHFLGAVVLENRHVQTGDVDVRLVVDGQQRLTTLQLMFRGVLDALDETDADPKLRARIRKAIRNDEEVVSDSERLKLQTRPADSAQFEAAMEPEAPTAAESDFLAARSYFREAASAFLQDDSVLTDPYSESGADHARASLLVATLLGLVKLVVIDLEDVDDAQVIFEALNARNTPLSATDLVKNLLFMRAEAQHLDAQNLYDKLWKRFDDDSDWWIESVGVGHAQRARQDWLLGDWLIAQRGKAINVGRLYGEFRKWMDESGTKPFDALSTLNRYADAYETLHGRKPGASSNEIEAVQRIELLNITVAMPLLLWLFVQPVDVLPPSERETAVRAVESFVVRRLAAKYQTRGYGPVFVGILKAAQDSDGPIADAVVEAMRAAATGHAWPSSNELADAFETARFYGPGGMSQERLRMILGAVDRQMQLEATKSENMTIDYDSLQIEHIIPQDWRKFWPVAGADETETLLAEQRRDGRVNRIGNLTLVNDRLNPAMGNDPWSAKRAELKKHSKLQLNVRLLESDEWTDDDVKERGRWLAEQVDKVWPGPESEMWS